MRFRFGWSLIFGALVFLTALKLSAEEKPSIQVPHVDHAPQLEDFINGKPRQAELRITDFRQREPRDGAPASQPTEAFISYDDRNLYVAFVCKANPRTIRAHMVKREDIAGDDSVSVSLDTFHDGQRAYEFFANPLGIQMDGITSEGVDDDDFSFDAVWQSRGKITADGYVVLFSIPFKSLRFHSRSRRASTWGIALGRVIPGNRELSTWPLLTQKVEAYVPQFASMESPEHAHSARNMEFTPYVFAAGEKALDTTTIPAIMQTQPTYRGGIDAKVVLHDSFTLDATVNPDFSQVETDEPQVTTNQRYEVYFPEKRPFFLENSDFFNTPETLLFTRRIIDPQYGVRLTGKVGNWKVGLLAVDDRAPGVLEPINSSFFGQRAENFAGRIQRSFNNGSNIGVMFTRRQFGDTSTTLASADMRLKLGQNWVFTGQYMQSGVLAGNGQPLEFAKAIYGSLKYTGRKFNYSTTYQDRDPLFAGDVLGFFTRTDIRSLNQNVSYLWRPENGNLTSVGPAFSANAVYDHENVLQNWYADLPLQFNFKGPTSFSFGRSEYFERYLGTGFRKNSSYATFSTHKLRIVGFSASYAQGLDINYFPAAGVPASLGNAIDASAALSFKPGKHLQFEEKYILSRLGSIAQRGVIYENHIARSKLNYQLTRPLSFRLIVDYNGLAGNPLIADFDPARHFSYDFLMTYLVHPGTAIYIGYNDNYQNLVLDPTNPLSFVRTTDFTHLTSRQFFVKLSYAFRL
ncbi:MAG TPA: DUF5916 domain-containing protein [Candidatus Angelobacter sp.]|nr:DUF5916 domain-containing protein [Candidatus Angelobacter sp.]